jgi:hypothetical protein
VLFRSLFSLDGELQTTMPPAIIPRKMLRQSQIATAVALLFGGVLTCTSQQIRSGVWAASEVQPLPLPTAGFQAYIIGELHGIEENAQFELKYLASLNKVSGLRDVAIEEKSVYGVQAEAYVEGKSGAFPRALCLRTEILDGIRHLNSDLSEDERIRIHLVDIDSPASAIRQHLLDLKQRIPGAEKVNVPEVDEIKAHGLAAVSQLQQLNVDARTRSELRTLEHSIGAYQQGFEVTTGRPAGSPYLEDREQAVASNIEDLLQKFGVDSILVLYGADHVSKLKRNDGGPNRDQPFAPMAMRLEQAGVKLFSVMMFPLAGKSSWRGDVWDFPWQPSDGHLSSGETLDKVLASVPQARFIYIVVNRERVRMPTTDVSHLGVDAFLLFPSGTPLIDHCTAR